MKNFLKNFSSPQCGISTQGEDTGDDQDVDGQTSSEKEQEVIGREQQDLGLNGGTCSDNDVVLPTENVYMCI